MRTRTKEQTLTKALYLAISCPEGREAEIDALVQDIAATLPADVVERCKWKAQDQAARDCWETWVREHRLPADIPPRPDRVYRKEWKGWADWIGWEA